MKAKGLFKYALQLFLTTGLAIYVTFLFFVIILGNILKIWETNDQPIIFNMTYITLTFSVLIVIWLDKQLFPLSLQYGLTRNMYTVVMALLSGLIAVILLPISMMAVLCINSLKIVPSIHFELLILNDFSLNIGQQIWLVFWLLLLINSVGLLLAVVIMRFNVIGNSILALLLISITGTGKGLFLAVIPQSISHNISNFMGTIIQSMTQSGIFLGIIILILLSCLYLLNKLRILPK